MYGVCMELEGLERRWNEAGKQDPFWAVLSAPDKKGNRWQADQFFQTGVDEIDQVMSHLRQLGVDVLGHRALDFGCGPGRLTQALAAHFEQVDGVDISPSMIALAERLNQRADHCRYHLNETDDLRRFADHTFDFVYSSITLQHVGPANARSYLKELIRVLAPGGVLVFQLPGRQTGRLRQLKAFAPAPVLAAYRRLRYHGHPAASMTGIPREEVLRFCESTGVTVIDVETNQDAGTGWESFRYYGRRVSSPGSRT